VPAGRRLQSAAPAACLVSAVTTATHRVREEWRARIAAEYTSAAITQELTLWLIQAGAPPDLIEAGLAVVGDELTHSRMSHDVYVEAGGSAPPAIVREQLGLARRSDVLEHDILHAAVRVFCLGETVAVPLFAHLRAPCTQPVARAALDRILVDEVRHRDFGWDLLDWLCASPIGERVPTIVERELPAMLGELEAGYGTKNPTVASDADDMTAAERAWGLAPPREYAAILAQTINRDYRPRFAARGITIEPPA
jgi:hypothetical protein